MPRGEAPASEAVDAPRRRVTLDEVRAHRDEIMEIARRRKVRAVRIFGSVARGEADDESDLDLLLDMEPEGSLVDMSGFALDVDVAALWNVVTIDIVKLRPQIRAIRDGLSDEYP